MEKDRKVYKPDAKNAWFFSAHNFIVINRCLLYHILVSYFKFFSVTLLQSLFILIAMLHIIVFADTIVVQKLISGYCSPTSGDFNLGEKCVEYSKNFKPAYSIEKYLCEFKDGYTLTQDQNTKAYSCQSTDTAVRESDNEGQAKLLSYLDSNVVDTIKDIIFSPLTGILFALWVIRSYLRSNDLLPKLIMVTIVSVYLTLEIIFNLDYLLGLPSLIVSAFTFKV